VFFSAPLQIISIFTLSLRHVYTFGLKCHEIFSEHTFLENKCSLHYEKHTLLGIFHLKSFYLLLFTKILVSANGHASLTTPKSVQSLQFRS